jgi:hypothetical protein
VLRIAAESPSPAQGCAEQGCEHERVGPLDVFCRTHDRFLPRWLNTRGWTGRILAGAVTSFTFGAFSLSAQLHRRFPLALLYAGIAAAVLLLPIRRFHITRRVAAAVWVVAVLGGGALLLWPNRYIPVVGTLFVTMAALFWVRYISRFAARRATALRSALPASDVAQRWVASSLATAPALVAVALTARSHRSWLIGIPRSWDGWLLALSLGAVTAGVALAAVVGILLGSRWAAHRAVPRLPFPRRPRPLRTPVQVSARLRRRGVSSIGALTMRAVARLEIAMVVVAFNLANVLRVSGWVAVCAAIRVANVLWRCAAILVLFLVASLADIVQMVGRGVIVAADATYNALRAVGIPLAGVSAAAATVVLTATRTERYLVAGSLNDLEVLVGSAAAGVVCLTIAWVFWSGRGLPEAIDSARHSLANVLPQAMVLVTLGGWVIGLPGTLGHGVVRVGGLTLALTGLLAGAVIGTMITGRSGELFDRTRPGAEEAV